MKKILIVIGSLDLGGTEKQLLKILQRLNNSYEIHIALIWKRGSLFSKFKELNLKIHEFYKTKFLGNKILGIIYTLTKIKKILKPQIVHYILPHAYLIGGFLSFFKGKTKFLMSRRSMNYYQKKFFLLKFFEITLHKRMDLIIGNSRKVVDQLIESELVNKNKCHLIHNGVEKKNFFKRKKKKKIKIIMVANFISYKNHEMLIKACFLINKSISWELDFVGNFTDKNLVRYLKSLVSSLKLTKKIFFLGQKNDVNFYVKNADIGVLTSNEEGFSNSLLEYMSFSLPVVVTDVGGNSDVVNDNINGFLVKKNDVDELANRLNLLLNSYNLRIKFGRNGNKQINKNFSIELTAKKYKKIYSII